MSVHGCGQPGLAASLAIGPFHLGPSLDSAVGAELLPLFWGCSWPRRCWPRGGAHGVVGAGGVGVLPLEDPCFTSSCGVPLFLSATVAVVCVTGGHLSHQAWTDGWAACPSVSRRIVARRVPKGYPYSTGGPRQQKRRQMAQSLF